MAKKRKKSVGKGKKGSEAKRTPRRKRFDDEPVDERRAAAYARLMEAEQVLYDRWEAETGAEKMSWVGELVGYPVEETNLWVMALGEKVAAMGGQLELIAVFGAERVTLVREPTLAENPIDAAFRARFDEQELGDELPNPDGESDNNDA